MILDNAHIWTIGGVNHKADPEKRRIYSLLIPDTLRTRFNIKNDFFDNSGNDLLRLVCAHGSSSAEMALHHQFDFPDPILYGHITDTLNGRIHILLYILNDPTSPRFDVDQLPDGKTTKFGTLARNIEAEKAAMEYGLAPGQIRRGLRLLGPAIQAFEEFVTALGQEYYSVEPLYYHNAIIFERFGFTYQQGRKLMNRLHDGFEVTGDLLQRLDGSTPFRMPEAAKSIRLRSWAIHDNLLGEPFTDVIMYKQVGKSAGVNSCPDCTW